MKMLLSEGSGLTSRQVAGILAAKGHKVGVVSSDPIGLTRFTHGVRHWHPIRAFSADPVGWLDTAIDVYTTNGYDVLFPTQEQVAVLSAHPQRLADAGVATAVPTFESLLAVQDKIAATSTLNRLGLAQPVSQVVSHRDDLAGWDRFPVYVKTPIGTATSGIIRLDDEHDLRRCLDTDMWDEAFDDGGVVVQTPVDGPLAMVQTVFDNGRLIAFHANLRIREGARGGASHKRSIHAPVVRQMMHDLGAALQWNGALSVDVIFTGTGPVIITSTRDSSNPRTHSEAASTSSTPCSPPHNTTQRTSSPTEQPTSAPTNSCSPSLAPPNTATADDASSKNSDSARHRNDYYDSTEELTPLQPRPGRRDWRAPVPVAAAAAATLIAPTSWHRFASNSVESYALSPGAWRSIRDRPKTT